MPWMEVELNPKTDWNSELLTDLTDALKGFFGSVESLDSNVHNFPGYQIIEVGPKGELGEIILSNSERKVKINKVSPSNSMDQEFAYFLFKFSRQMGVKTLCISYDKESDKEFWKELGGRVQPEPVLLEEKINPEEVDVSELYDLGLSVSYKGLPCLCLEPIFCTTHSKETVSLSQRRLEKMLGDIPIGFASRIAANSHWNINQQQWNDLLAYSRLECYDVLLKKVVSLFRH